MAANVDHDYQNIPGSLFDYFKTSENENEDIEKIGKPKTKEDTCRKYHYLLRYGDLP